MTKRGSDEYTVRTMQPEEVEETYEMIDKEGWNLTLDKFSALYKSSPDNFFVAVSPDGEVASTMSLIPTFEGEYVLGNLVVKDGHRNRGLGRKLVDEVFALFPNAVVSLTAVPGADQFYLNTDFHFTQPQQGQDIVYILLDREKLKQKSAEAGQQDVTVSLYSGHSFDKLIVGFGVGFIKREKIVLDGLFADSDAIAVQIFTEIVEQFPGINSVKLQVPSSRLFLSELGAIQQSYRYNRYSRGQPTLSPLSKVYNVSDCDYTY
ncbi:unnamed protein product [Candidula unifasciata]|uniref:N-acetyltransferase domain-containing protein n=1 Tax=Candidula unifasciata TaxID=100452 RepID=A0A8S4A483_9EUPU|nr:unnamed protein product [Candidula unifasciata]